MAKTKTDTDWLAQCEREAGDLYESHRADIEDPARQPFIRVTCAVVRNYVRLVAEVKRLAGVPEPAATV